MRILLLSLVAVVGAFAQTGNGRIEGTIRDKTGAVVPGAAIEIVHRQTSQTFNTKSNASGLYIFPSVQPGDYTVAVRSAGMAEWRGQLLLQTGQTAVVEPALALETTTSEITVLADVTPLVTTTAPTLGNVLERERVDQLPLSGRFIQNLIATVTPGMEYYQNWPMVNGIRMGGMEYLQDGAALTNRERNSIPVRPPGIDTVSEVKVETNGSSAKFNRPATAIFTTRGGTNQLHGSLFETARNNGLGIARRREDFYDKPPKLIRNEFGASAGGPVVLPKLYNGKNRTFFFAAWEAYRLFSSSTTGTSMPTEAMRNGDYSTLINAAGQRTTLYDPLTTDGVTWVRQPFLNNQIPLSRRNPLAKWLWDHTPLPTLANVNPMVGSNWFGSSVNNRVDYTVTARLDHRLGDRDQIFGRYSQGKATTKVRRSVSTNGSPVLKDEVGNLEGQIVPNYSGMTSWSHTFSPTFFVETVFSGTSEDLNFTPVEDLGPGKNLADQLNLPNPWNAPGLPDFPNAGFNMSYVGEKPRNNITKILSLDQNYSLVRGKHQLEFGWRFRYEMIDILSDQTSRQGSHGFGSMATSLYDPATRQQAGAVPRTGHDNANFFLGIANIYSANFQPGFMYFRGNEYASYLQDNWKVSSRLMLNLGLRYEYYPPLRETRNFLSSFDPKSRTVVLGATLDEMVVEKVTTPSLIKAFQAIGVKFSRPSDAGLPEGLINSNHLDFSPRIGFAYRLSSGKRAASLRGGYGLYRFQLALRTFASAMRSSPPMQANFQVNLNAAAQTPDGLPNYLLRSVPTVYAGVNSRNVLDPNSPPDVAPGNFTVAFFDPNQPTSRNHQWNLTFERELFDNTVARIGYVGSHGSKLDQWFQMNGAPTNYVWLSTTGLPVPTGRLAGTARRVFDQTTYGNVNEYTKTGYSNFNSVQMEISRRYTKGYGFQLYYVISNNFRTLGANNTGPAEDFVNDPRTYMPGAVPEDLDQRIRLLTYIRDIEVPKHRIRWNWIVDLPFGKGKKLFGNIGGWKQRVIGGWQLAGSGAGRSNYFQLPTTDWGAIAPIELYGKEFKIQDCRSGECVPGYLWYNGYIPANRINSTDAQGQPNGVMGVPANYQPSHQPVNPIPANGGSPSDPNYALYETQNTYVRLKDGTLQRIAVDTGLHPWRNQLAPAPWDWGLDASLFKIVPVTERVFLRFNADFFNVLNCAGLPSPNAGSGIVSLRTSGNGPRQLQLSLRLTW